MSAAAGSWEYAAGIALFVVSGVALALQNGVNAQLGASTTKPFAAVVSFIMGAACCALALLVDSTAISHRLPSVADMRGAPWWAWLGGVLGAWYVIVSIVFVTRIGSGTAVAVFVCAQLVSSVVIDLLGLVGFQRRAFSWPRITGVTLMFMGVVLVTQFPGEPVTNSSTLPSAHAPPAPASLAAAAAHAKPGGADLSSNGSLTGSSSSSSISLSQAELHAGLGRRRGLLGGVELPPSPRPPPGG